MSDMEDSEIVTFGPQSGEQENAEETLQDLRENKSRTEDVAETMRRLADECFRDFSNKMETMLGQISLMFRFSSPPASPVNPPPRHNLLPS